MADQSGSGSQPQFPDDDPSRSVQNPGRRSWIVGAVSVAVIAAAGYYGWLRFGPNASGNMGEAPVGDMSAGAGSGAPQQETLGPIDKFSQSPVPVPVTVRGQEVFVDFTGGVARVLSGRCPHRGCNVNWDADKKHFICPCHDSLFARDGSVIQGPAVSPLATLPSSVQGTEVVATV